MIVSRLFGCGLLPCRNRFYAGLFGLLAGLGGAPALHATGFYGPQDYLGSGGKYLYATPEFYWDLEVKRLARDFHPPEKRLTPPVASDGSDFDKPVTAAMDKMTADTDLSDFAEALKAGAIKPPDIAKASDEHAKARDAIAAASDKTTAPLPDEFDSEFADYHRGAYAWRLGKAHWDEARKAWEALLNRPAPGRHYRSVWAAFMLGKLAMKEGDYPQAVKWFQTTRQLARDGFADSLGMAADSYGWEGRSEWKQGHPEKAAPCFLNQLALGDESAIVSLKALVPDRAPVDGMLNYGPEVDDISKWTEDQKKTGDEKAMEGLKAAAADPLLCRLITAHILATGTGANFWFSDSAAATNQRSARWLSVIDQTKSGTVDDAEYLGWVAYNCGDYKNAARWLKLANPGSPAACWLRAKLQLRDGNLKDAAKSLAQAWDTLRDPAAYTGWNYGDADDFRYVYGGNGEGWTFPQAASGDLAQLRLARNDFIQALDTFYKGDLWEDTAYVAERVLTADEFKAYVDKLPAPSASADDKTQMMRNLLGRRLVREDRYDEAMAYLTPPYGKILEKYVKALKDGANESLSKTERAKAWFSAAWLARHDGMELMGTEASPDGFDSGGDFQDTDIAKERLSGSASVTDSQGNPATIAIKPSASKQEVQRLRTNRIRPDVRFHYRVIAGSLAVRAANLLDNNTVELADVLNTAGNWVRDTDDKAADRIYQIIEKRCANTETGRADIAKHWFTDATGPWSSAQDQAYHEMHQKLDVKDGQQGAGNSQ